MIKAIFFDFDMTLVNSLKMAKKSYLALSRISGIKPSVRGFDEYVGIRVSESLEFFSKGNKDLKKKIIKEFYRIHLESPSRLEIYGKKALHYLKKNNIKIIIISRNSKKVIEAVAKAHRLPYDWILADEDMKKGEEKHQAIKRMLKKLRLKNSEIYYIVDHINDILKKSQSQDYQRNNRSLQSKGTFNLQAEFHHR